MLPKYFMLAQMVHYNPITFYQNFISRILKIIVIFMSLEKTCTINWGIWLLKESVVIWEIEENVNI